MSDEDVTWVPWEDLKVGMQVGPTCKIKEIYAHHPSGLRMVEVTGGFVWEIITGCWVLSESPCDS